MRDTYGIPMKILYIILVLLLSLTVTSCERLGVEVTTVKGEWKSESYNNQHLILLLSNNGTSAGAIFYNDSLLDYRPATWSLHNDTLSFYRQETGGVSRFKIEQMSMNTLTLRNVSNEKIWIMTRQYVTPGNDYDSHFKEVFDLKKGFWWYAWEITLYILSGLLAAGLLGLLCSLCPALIKWIRSIIKKKCKKK